MLLAGIVVGLSVVDMFQEGVLSLPAAFVNAVVPKVGELEGSENWMRS